MPESDQAAMNIPIALVEDESNLLSDAQADKAVYKGSKHFVLHFLFIALGIALCLVALALIFFNIAEGKTGERVHHTKGISSHSFPGCGKVPKGLCGVFGRCPPLRKRRLVGGTVVKQPWPWMAKILENGRHRCGGVLITHHTVLTAAHCFFRHRKMLKREHISVNLGVLEHPLGTLNHYFDVESIHVHSAFDPVTLRHDIAVIKLKRGRKVDQHVNPICLSSSLLSKEDKTKLAKVTGWGRKYEDGYFSKELREISVPLVSSGECSRANQGIFKHVHVDQETNICAGYGAKRMEYGCTGDSGGPLMLQNKAGEWVLVGIMSWGDPTCSPQTRNSYTVFSRVGYYENWIARQM